MTDRVCVIGAGSSGLTTMKALLARGIPFDCFEISSDIGGNWRYDNENNRSAAYRNLHIDTSKERMQFSDFPMPADYPNYPHHTQVLAYFEAYADHFKLRPHITFRTQVMHVDPAPDGGYAVTIRSLAGDAPEIRHYRAILVCSGHHWNPRWPDFPGQFSGRITHSRAYRDALPYVDSRVLVVGIGNSGADIACEVSRVARQAYLSTRRSAYIIPRYILGRPTDKWLWEPATRLPWPVQRLLYRLLLQIGVGNQTNYGVPYPQHQLLSEHPTMSADLLNLVSLGEIILKPDVAELCGAEVRFVDGSQEAIDAIIYATGYNITFPFFDAGFLSVDDNQIALYRRVVHPHWPSLYFIGLIQPLGAIMPLAEWQARWVAGLLSGELLLPDRATMARAIVQEETTRRKRYVNSARHTIQVDFYPYLRQLKTEIRLGRQRAQAQLAVAPKKATAST